MNWLVFVCLLVWIYILTVLCRAKLNFWYYICGSVGLFIFSLILIEPYVVVPLQKAVSAVAGVIGELTHLYDSYFQQGILFIQNGGTSLSLYIDFECSGVSMIGVLAIFLANVLRIFFICLLVHIWGIDMYFFAHTIFARILFYGCTVFLYFYVFTKPQIVRQKVGAFRYDSN